MTTATSAPIDTDRSGEAGAVFGMCVSHAPQIYLRPPEEDPTELARVHAGYRLIAERAAALELDLLFLVALDHVHNNFFNLVPALTVFTGEPVSARFNSIDVRHPADSMQANNFLDHLLESGFDPAFSQRLTLDHSFMVPLSFAIDAGLTTPVIPIVLNAYVPPQPSIHRCHALGQEIDRWARGKGLRVGVVGTGGMSHFPGTARYSEPDLEADQMVLRWLRDGEPERLWALSASELDKYGMVELRTWALAFGAAWRGEPATVHSYWDSGHCGYAIVEI